MPYNPIDLHNTCLIAKTIGNKGRTACICTWMWVNQSFHSLSNLGSELTWKIHYKGPTECCLRKKSTLIYIGYWIAALTPQVISTFVLFVNHTPTLFHCSTINRMLETPLIDTITEMDAFTVTWGNLMFYLSEDGERSLTSPGDCSATHHKRLLGWNVRWIDVRGVA